MWSPSCRGCRPTRSPATGEIPKSLGETIVVESWSGRSSCSLRRVVLATRIDFCEKREAARDSAPALARCRPSEDRVQLRPRHSWARRLKNTVPRADSDNWPGAEQTWPEAPHFPPLVTELSLVSSDRLRYRAWPLCSVARVRLSSRPIARCDDGPPSRATGPIAIRGAADRHSP